MTPWPVRQGFELICLRNSFEIEPWKSSHCQTLPSWFLEVGLQTLERLRWKHKLQWAAVVHAGAGCCCSFTANRCHLLSFMFTQPSADPTRCQTYIWQYENGGPALSPPPSHPSAKNTSTQHAALPHCCHWIHCQHDAGSLLFGQTGSFVFTSARTCVNHRPLSVAVCHFYRLHHSSLDFALTYSSWLFPDCVMNSLAKTQPSPPDLQSR